MIEFFTGLILGLGWWWIPILSLGSIILDRTEHYFWSLVTTILIFVSCLVLLNLSWQYIFYIAIFYIPVGFLWSFWRWYQNCKKVINEIEDKYNSNYIPSNYTLDNLEDKVAIHLNLHRITGWVLSWPVSIFCYLLEDVLVSIEKTIRNISKYTYTKWSDEAVSKIRDIKNKKESKDLEDYS